MQDNCSKDWGRIAVLVVDIQNDFCDENGAFARQGLDVQPAQKITPKIQEFIEEIRKYDVPIIYTKMIESQEITPKNLRRLIAIGKLINTEPVCAPSSWGSALYRLKPLDNEYVLEKRTYDAFSNPELLKTLSRHKVKTLVIAGVNTDVCIDTTVRRAFTEGYQIIVPRDLVATMNKAGEKHYLVVFDRFFGDVVDSKTVLSCLARS